ncbi:MAG: uroporphyrinogen-III synthase [Cellvibrionaceae bacterium]
MTKPTLNDWRVLNTRPDAQAEKWQQALTEAGAVTVRLPLMAIEALTDSAQIQAIKDRIMSVSDYQHAIFVSQNAAHYGLDWLDQYWPELPYELKFYAVGRATAQCLSDYGCRVIEAGNTMNSEALLALPTLQDLTHQKVVIFRGLGGRPLLAEQLVQRGAQVDYCELYRRVFPRQGAEQTLIDSQWGGDRDIVAVHSGESLLNWIQLLDEMGETLAASNQAHKPAQLPYNQQQLKQLVLLVPGQRVAAMAREHQFTRVVVAENASDQAMLDALNFYCAETGN